MLGLLLLLVYTLYFAHICECGGQEVSLHQ